jgi:hypothetical protein
LSLFFFKVPSEPFLPFDKYSSPILEKKGKARFDGQWEYYCQLANLFNLILETKRLHCKKNLLNCLQLTCKELNFYLSLVWCAVTAHHAQSPQIMPIHCAFELALTKDLSNTQVAACQPMSTSGTCAIFPCSVVWIEKQYESTKTNKNITKHWL